MTNEKRLIDANALMAQLEDRQAVLVKGWGYRDHYTRGFEEAVETVNDAPTVDATEVVRCKDCWKSADGLCSYQFKNVPGKDFCGDGERINNG